MTNSIKRIIAVSTIISVLFASAPVLYAADGSGTAGVSPAATVVNSTGNTFAVTYTAAETMADGGVKITVPSGWSAPQLSSGTAGYVTTSTTGTTGTVESNLDSATGWSDNSILISTDADTSVKKEGSASLRASVTASVVNGRIYYNYGSAQDWSSKNKLSFWFRSSAVLTAGDLDLMISESTNLSGAVSFDLPTGLLSALAPGTWVHVVVDLSGSAGSNRDAVRSIGFELPTVSVLSNFYFDNMMLGPATTPTLVSGQTIEVPLMALPSGGTVTFNYGQGGGTSGVTVGGSSGAQTIGVQSKIDNSGVYVSIASAPQITLGNGTPTSLTLFSEPTSISAGLAMSPLVVRVLDNQGQLVTTDNSTQVTIGLAAQPVGGGLSGTTTVTASSGVATFNNVRATIPGSGYQLSASASGLGTITSSNTLTALGAVIKETGGTTLITEGGASDTFTVELNAAPTHNVTVAFTADSQVTLDAPSVTFSPSDWSTPKTVEVSAAVDGLTEGAHTSTVTMGVTSTDLRFNGTAALSVVASITDQGDADPSLVFTQAPTSVGVGIPVAPAFVVQLRDENGALVTSDSSTQVTMTLSSAPAGGVIEGTTVETAASGIVTFDDISVNEIGSGYVFTVSAPGFESASTVNLSALGTSLEESGGSTSVVEGGATDTISYVLSSLPTHTVTLTIDPDDEVTVSQSSLTFTTSNWSVPQNITVTAVDDTDVEGSHVGSITVEAGSTDLRFHGADIDDVVVAIADNDSVPSGGGGGGSLPTTTVSEDLDGDGVNETATDADNNRANGYEIYVSGSNSKVIITIDGDGDGKMDHFIDVNRDGIPDWYWDPDNKIKSKISVIDENNDKTADWTYDADGDGKIDHYYNPKNKTIVSLITGRTIIVPIATTCTLYGNKGTVVKGKSRGEAAKGVQQALNQMNIVDTALVVDGVIGQKSLAAMRVAQQMIKTKSDGVWGPITQGIYANWVAQGCPKLR